MAESSTSENINILQPNRRFLIPINTFHVPKKLLKLFKRNNYIFKMDNDFKNVISQCKLINRKDNDTWINNTILNSYIKY